MTASLLMLAAMLIESLFGWPSWLYRRIRHPVVWIGALISALDVVLNRSQFASSLRYILGALTTVIVVTATALCALAVSHWLPNTIWGYAIEAVVASGLIATRNLYVHVAAVARPLACSDLEGAREAVSHIVGRDPAQLDSLAIARASLESLAENASDGVIAPVFWGAIFGLPGLAAYKAINTLDSMIGHKSPRHLAFGRFSARLDDLVNLIPARLTAAVIVIASGRWSAISINFRDASNHRSPNAGWPETALAVSLGVRLSGPRLYDGQLNNEPWINGRSPDPDAASVQSGLELYIQAMLLAALILAIIATLELVQ